MKCFLAMNEEGLDYYKSHLAVAVTTCPKNIDLFLIYQGKNNAFIEWLNTKKVTVIQHQLTFEKLLLERSQKPKMQLIGNFLRLDIPLVCKKLGLSDNYVLYTDVDVFFRGDLEELSQLKPEYFAAAPEIEQDNWQYINSGVLWMNVNNLFETLPTCIEEINNENTKIYDQSILNKFYKGKWDKLPLIYNWKAYWELNPEAKIVHFHGPGPEKTIKQKNNMKNAHYYSWCAEFYRELEKCQDFPK